MDERREAKKENLELKQKQLENDSLKIEIAGLREEFDILRAHDHQMTDELLEAENKIRQLLLLIEDIKSEHNIQVKDLGLIIDNQEKYFNDKITNMNKNKMKVSDSFKQEVKVKDEIVKRYASYVDVLKKEIAVCKNMIKNPDIMKQVIRQ